LGDTMDSKKIIQDKWPYLYFLILTIVVFAGFIFSNKMLFGSDTVEAGIFFRSFYAEFVKAFHRVPLWDPYIYGGLPFVDAMHGDTFYPLAALQFFMPIEKALGYKLVITVFLAGVFTYLYLRKMNMSRWAGVFGGTAYMLSGFLVSLVYAGHDGRMYVTSLLPFLLYTMEIGFKRKNLLWWWPFSVAFGLLILANHPQFAYFSMWCVGAYFVLRMIFLIKEDKIARARIIPIIGFIAAMAFGLCLALVSIWPTQDYVRKYSPRAEEGKGYEYAASWALHSEEAISQIVPGFSGYSTLSGHPDLSAEQTYWGKNYFKINSEYAGLIAIILGIIGLFIIRDRFSWFFVGTAIFALLYALGSSGVIFKIIYYIVPFVSKFRAPSTIMFLFCFSMTFLAARAMDQLEKAKKIPSARTILIVLFVAAGVYLLKALLVATAGMGIMKIYTAIFYSNIEPGQMSNLEANLPNITGGLFAGAAFLGVCALLFWAIIKKKTTFNFIAIAFIVLVLIDSWLLNDMKFIRPVDASPYFTKPPIANRLDKEPKPFRVFAMQGALSNQNLLAQFGIDEMTGYHGNQLRWYDNFIGGSSLSNLFVYKNGNAVGLSPNMPKVLGLTNSRYFLMKQKASIPGFGLIGSSPDGINIYQDSTALPRARIVYSYQVVENPDSALARVMNPSFDYVNSIVIDRNPTNQISVPISNPGDNVAFLQSPLDQVKIRATLSSTGLLALQDNWYPYWKAYEGKTELPIFRADYTFMAVELAPGTHEIEFRLENPKYILGKNVTMISWLVLLVGLGVGIVISRRKPGGEHTHEKPA
jgi:hypothetical protein